MREDMLEVRPEEEKRTIVDGIGEKSHLFPGVFSQGFLDTFADKSGGDEFTNLYSSGV